MSRKICYWRVEAVNFSFEGNGHANEESRGGGEVLVKESWPNGVYLYELGGKEIVYCKR